MALAARSGLPSTVCRLLEQLHQHKHYTSTHRPNTDPEHAEIKTLLLGPVTEQSAQKALITAMLADDPDE
jgi:hypothetical protein